MSGTAAPADSYTDLQNDAPTQRRSQFFHAGVALGVLAASLVILVIVAGVVGATLGTNTSSSNVSTGQPVAAVEACANAMAAFKQTNDAHRAPGSAVSDAAFNTAALNSLEMCGPENGINDGGATWKAQAVASGYARGPVDEALSELCAQSDPQFTTALCMSQ